MLLSGCATTVEPRKFSFTPFGTQEVTGLLFPSLSEGSVPRYVYLGELLGDPNFSTPAGKPLDLRGIFDLLVGSALGTAAPRLLYRPQSVLVDPRGRILITDFGRGSILVFDPAEGRLDEWLEADKTHRFLAPVAIANGPDGGYFVSDADNGFVARLNRDGVPVDAIGRGHLSRPTGVAYDSALQRLFVTDTPAHQIKVFGADGQLLDVWGEQGDASDSGDNIQGTDAFSLNWPTHLAMGRDKLYIADSMNARVVVISPETGRQLTSYGRRGTFVGNLVRPKGVAVDREENLYVVEGYHDHLLIFNLEGQYLMAIGGEGAKPGQFVLPSGIWVDQSQRIYIADTHNGRVQVFQFLGGDRDDEE
jgi:DNA-binding beta-propeller fold protein YncE